MPKTYINCGATNAKNAPIKYISTETKYTTLFTRLSLIQAFALLASMGQGALRALHLKKPAINNKNPDIPKVKVLCFDRVIKNGTVLTNPARLAPNPKVTNRAGRAQQSKVEKLVNKLSVDIKPFFISSPF